MGRLDGASSRLDEARTIARVTDDHRYVIQADLLLAQVKFLQADLDGALLLVRAVLAQVGRLDGAHRSMARSLFGEILWAQGDHAGADDALAASVDPSDPWSMAFSATARLNLALDRNDLAAAETHAAGGGDRRLPLLRSAAGLLQVRLDLVDEGVAAIQDAVEECRWRTDPVGAVSCLLQLGEANLRSGAPVAADGAYAEAVAMARDCGLGLALVRGLDGLAIGRQRSGADTSELLQESNRLRAAHGNPRPPSLRQLLDGRR
jgi:hypothetical protein